jgi:hypothetical protein
VIQHLVGHDVLLPDGPDDTEAAPDEDYVIGGTGLVKALTCCLKNRGDESQSQSEELMLDVGGGGDTTPLPKVTPGKAKDMSKHLLLSARKIRARLQPVITKAKAASSRDTNTYRKCPTPRFVF